MTNNEHQILEGCQTESQTGSSIVDDLESYLFSAEYFTEITDTNKSLESNSRTRRLYFPTPARKPSSYRPVNIQSYPNKLKTNKHTITFQGYNILFPTFDVTNKTFIGSFYKLAATFFA